jgi:hypothetical protein
MRGFFILLLLTNLLFFGWQFWFAPEQEQPKPYGGMVPANKGLVLLSELDESVHPQPREYVKETEAESTETEAPVELIEPEVRADETATPEEPASPLTLCYSTVPLASSNEIEALKGELARIGIDETASETIETQTRNYWVMLAPYKSRNKAKEASDILKKRRVKDFFIVGSGQYENAISLGVYSSRERADLRYRQITSLKARLRKPVIEALELPAKRTVISFELEDGNEPEGLTKMLDTSDEPKLKKIPCK